MGKAEYRKVHRSEIICSKRGTTWTNPCQQDMGESDF